MLLLAPPLKPMNHFFMFFCRQDCQNKGPHLTLFVCTTCNLHYPVWRESLITWNPQIPLLMLTLPTFFKKSGKIIGLDINKNSNSSLDSGVGPAIFKWAGMQPLIKTNSKLDLSVFFTSCSPIVELPCYFKIFWESCTSATETSMSFLRFLSPDLKQCNTESAFFRVPIDLALATKSWDSAVLSLLDPTQYYDIFIAGLEHFVSITPVFSICLTEVSLSALVTPSPPMWSPSRLHSWTYLFFSPSAHIRCNYWNTVGREMCFECEGCKNKELNCKVRH